MRIIALFISSTLLFNCNSDSENLTYELSEDAQSKSVAAGLKSCERPIAINQTKYEVDLLLHAKGDQFYSPQGAFFYTIWAANMR